MSKPTTVKAAGRGPKKIIAGPQGAAISVDLHVRNKREKLIASKRAAGLSPELAESTADRQIDLDNGKVRAAFANPNLDREEAIATEGVNTNAAQIPHNPNSDEVPPVEVNIKTDAKE